MRLEIKGLTVGYGSQPIVFEATATFAGGVITAIIGPNGAGKSTLVKGLVGSTTVFAGSVSVDGTAVPNLHPRALLEKGVAYVPQLANVFPSLSVRENLEIGAYVRRGAGGLARVLDVLPQLSVILGKPAGKLSGGQRNMVAVGRALMSDPQVLVVDEGTAGLAPQVADALWADFQRLAALGVGIVVVEQNVDSVLRFANEVLLLTGGRIRMTGPVERFRHLNLADVFLEASVKLESDVSDVARSSEPDHP